MKKRIAGIAAVVALMATPAASASASWWGSCTIDGAGRPICYLN